MSVSVKKIVLAISLTAALFGVCFTVVANPVFEASGSTNVSSAQPLGVALHESTWDKTDTDNDGITDAASMLLIDSRVSMSLCVENTSEVDGWVYLVVDMPISTEGTSAYSFDLLDGWSKIGETISDDRIKCVYSYHEILPAHSTTSILFDDLVHTSDLLNTSDARINIKACAIQSAHVDSAAEGWDLYVAKAGAL